jgi:hypothetical protein
MKNLVLFEDFEPSSEELRDHSDRVNKVISEKEYSVVLIKNGEKIEKKAEVRLNYDSSNTEENSSYIKIQLGVGQFIELKTYINTEGKKELSVYKSYGIILDDESTQDIISIYEDIQDYIGFSTSEVMLIAKILNSRIKDEEENIIKDFKI